MIFKICCNSEKNKEFKIKEVMFDFRDEFTYFECSKCGCLQITEIPRNMGKYYPSNYYSFKSFKLQVEKSGLKVQYIIFNSTEFQFWGREQ